MTTVGQEEQAAISFQRLLDSGLDQIEMLRREGNTLGVVKMIQGLAAMLNVAGGEYLTNGHLEGVNLSEITPSAISANGAAHGEYESGATQVYTEVKKKRKRAKTVPWDKMPDFLRAVKDKSCRTSGDWPKHLGITAERYRFLRDAAIEQELVTMEEEQTEKGGKKPVVYTLTSAGEQTLEAGIIPEAPEHASDPGDGFREAESKNPVPTE